MTLATLLLPCVSSTNCPGSEEDCDVTLASTDCVLHLAHRRVLVAHSVFFSSLLEELGPDAVVYLGMDDMDLTSVLDLLYLGRATVATCRVEQVARCLEELHVSGLEIQKDDAQEVESSSSNTNVKDFVWMNSKEASEEETVKEEKVGYQKKSKHQERVLSNKSNLVSSLSHSPQLKEEMPRQTFSLGPEDMGALKQLWGKLVTVIKDNGRDQKLAFSCKECGKKSACRWNVYNHVDSHHLPAVQHKCDDCQMVFISHRALKCHVKTKHVVKVKDPIKDENLSCGWRYQATEGVTKGGQEAAGPLQCSAGGVTQCRGQEAAEEGTVEEENVGHPKKSRHLKRVLSKKSNLVSSLTPNPQLKEEMPRQTFSLGPEDMVALKQLWGKLVTVIEDKRGNGRDQKLVFSCKECGKESAGRWNAYNHVDCYHLPEVQHKCDNCHRVFISHRALKCHVKTKHVVKVNDSMEDEKLPCDMTAGLFKCDAGCRNRDRGKREGYKYEISRIRHYMKVHKQPTECCGTTFFEYNNFRKHNEEHHNKCTKCAKTFYTKVEMERHQKWKHETKPLKCSVCPAMVKNLDKHMKGCHTGKLMICSACPFNSRKKYNIETHYRKVHTELDVETCKVCGKRFKHLKKHTENTKCGRGMKAEATIPCPEG